MSEPMDDQNTEEMTERQDQAADNESTLDNLSHADEVNHSDDVMDLEEDDDSRAFSSLVDGFVDVPSGEKLQQILEGLLLATPKPLSIEKILSLFDEHERPTAEAVLASLEVIQETFKERGFYLVEVASGFRFQVKQSVGTWVSRLWEEKPQRYSRALMETLALIAYRQPITRGDIEDIRGVAVSTNIIKTLLEREWVRIVGHKDVPGRPAMYATTKLFLDYFGLSGLDQLPKLSEIKDLDKVEEQASESLENVRTLEDQLNEPVALVQESEEAIKKLAFEELEAAKQLTDSVEQNLFAPKEEDSTSDQEESVSQNESEKDSSNVKNTEKNEPQTTSSVVDADTQRSSMASLLQKHGFEDQQEKQSPASEDESVDSIENKQNSSPAEPESLGQVKGNEVPDEETDALDGDSIHDEHLEEKNLSEEQRLVDERLLNEKSFDKVSEETEPSNQSSDDEGVNEDVTEAVSLFSDLEVDEDIESTTKEENDNKDEPKP